MKSVFSFLASTTTKAPDRFITLLLHNKLGREARVIPSIDKRGYVVQPYSSVQVRIVTKGGPITLTGEDVETESRLLLNNSSSPITVTPSDTPDIITDISITAEGIVCKNES